MITQIAPYSVVGKINTYRANSGEGLRLHSHDAAHITMCTKGSCVVRTEGLEDVVLTPTSTPKQITHRAYLMHEIEALEDGTEIVNMFF